ncbi:nonribosomal peptide synthetase [Penicillium malachiteum]|uniref:nonribosomal peptide synthetase n=1 Tax=Penicillium malachiteum TaxID=1324776 RepID=UPI002546BDFD|nr:nonribosomal peptide synthetase [Penicillium malachiteum]KAJ5714400.1 nonribosomal peptide synthetase [Penicillium malachiteum]
MHHTEEDLKTDGNKPQLEPILQLREQLSGSSDKLSHEDYQKLEEWNWDVPDRVDRCVHEIIQERCLAQPDAPAVCAWDGTFTYRELDELSNTWVTHLTRYGVGPEVFVPLCFEKSRWTTVAMIAVMKAGGAFVLLDPSYPEMRLRSICSTISAELIVASVQNEAMAARLARFVVTIGRDQSTMGKDDRPRAALLVTPASAVYAVFTSGSTGMPKGVVMTHAAFNSGVLPYNQALNLENDVRILQFASYAFDASIIDIFAAFLSGACICIPSDRARNDNIAAFIQEYNVNWAHLTPSVLAVLEPERAPSLKTLVVAGEGISPAAVLRWTPHVRLVFGYGPSECAGLGAIQDRIEPGSDERNIGRAITCVPWIVDPDDYSRLLPVGAVGELVIEGHTVGREYINNPERSAAAFIEPPSWLQQFRELHPANAARLYKTGDLVQYTSDGTLRFIGRKDTQVKLRGQRIELGDVEHHMRRCFPHARDVVAELVTPTETGRVPVLVGFVWEDHPSYPENNRKWNTCDPENGLEDILAAPSDSFRAASQTAKSFLNETIPGYMVPGIFLPLTAIPLAKSGKTDRRQLRERAAALSQSELEAYSSSRLAKRQPATPAESTLQRLWACVLQIPLERVGADDHFFRLGGDSIRAMQLVAAARADGFSLAVADIFNSPQLSQLSHLLQKLSDLNTDLIAPFSLLDSAVSVILDLAVEQCQVSSDQIADIYPCTALQEGLMALTAKRAGTYIAHFSYSLALGGGSDVDSDVDRFRAAWNAVARANPILTTRMVQSDTGIFQVVVKDHIPCPIYVDEESYNAAQEQLVTGFRLGNPLVAMAIVKQADGPGSCRFVLSMHHAIYDVWSLPLLLEQVEVAFWGTPLTTQPFSPFIAYLSERKAATASFWEDEFDGLDTVHFPSLPSSNHTPTPTKTLTRTIPLSQNTGATKDFTPSTRLRLAWALTLAYYSNPSDCSNSSDIVFGLTVTGRGAPVAGIADMTGPTIATVPFRVQLNWDSTVVQCLREIQDHSARMIPNEQMGLQNIQRLSDEAASACQFQNLLVIQPRRESQGRDLFIQGEGAVRSDEGAFASHALTLLCELLPDSIEVEAIYDLRVIQESEVERLLCQLQHVMTQIHEKSDAMIKDLGVLSPEDQRQLQQCNCEVPLVNRCVHELILERCLAQPDVLAVCAWDGDMTYRELDRLSSILAARLTAQGVGPEVYVPLCFEKSRWTAVAMVGVMKAGGAFVLLDLLHPAARLQSICRVVSASVIVALPQNEEMAAILAAEIGAQVITIGASDAIDRHESHGDGGNFGTASSVAPSNAAYAVFTSGSTGEPKGVIIPHSAYCTGAMAHSKALGLTDKSRVFQFSSYAFDNSISDHLTTLVKGGCVCVPSEAARWSNLPQAISDLKANLCWLTPSVARGIQPADLSVETLILTGEAPAERDISQWVGNVELFNDYGPAECSVISTIQRYATKSSDPTNIGFATGGVCWVVHPQDHDKLLPIGAVGELLIEGPIVGRGYLNEPQKTIAAFITPPAWLSHYRHDQSLPRQIYKTGDLVQYTADLSLRFIGRKDTQVKLRGQRIELSEVEYHVQRCFPDARDVVTEVVLPMGAGREATLVAFIRTNSQEDHDHPENIFAAPFDAFHVAILVAESALEEVLPSYMVPAVFLPLVNLPLTVSGKTDRRLLRKRAAALSRSEIDAYSSSSAHEKRAPVTEAEHTLQLLWARVLNRSLDSISANDSFFRLGGDSIAAMRLCGIARKEGFSLAVADIFQQPRLANLAICLQPTLETPLESMAPFSLLGSAQDVILDLAVEQCQVQRDQIVDIYPCTALQEGLMALTAKKTGSYIAHFSYHLPEDIDLGHFQATWNAVAIANPILDTRIIQSIDQGCFQVVVPGTMQWNIERDGEDPMAPHATPSFGLGEPLVRATIIPSLGRFILAMHHAVYDAWSLPLLLQQAEAAFQGHSLTSQSFSPFISYLSKSEFTAETFWRSELTDVNVITFPPLPTPGYNPTPNESLMHTIPLPQSPWDDFTPSTKLRLAWALAQARYSNSMDVVFGLTVTGRGAPVNGGASVGQMLKKVQDQSTRMLPFEHIGLQKLQRLGDDALAACQFQSLLVIQPEAGDRDSLRFFIEEKDPISDQALGAFTTYALTLLCELSPNAVNVQAMYDPRVIQPLEVQRILHQFTHVMNQICQMPEVSIQDVSGVSPEDLRQLEQWNGIPQEPVHQCVHEMIKEKCLAQPDAEAVNAWDGDFTYQELHQLSEALTSHLTGLGLGIGPETITPLLFEKSRWTIVAMLAVIKMGGIFVMLDPSYPLARLHHICSIVSASLIITSGLNKAIAADLVAEIVVIGDDHTTWRNTGRSGTVPIVSPENTLCVVFTSGSTGTPKGAVISHTGYCTMVLSQAPLLGLVRDSRVFQFLSYAFDMGIFDHLATLITGGCICVPCDADRRSDLVGALRQYRATFVMLTPTVAKLLQPAEVPFLKTLVVGGETVVTSDFRKWEDSVHFVNVWGPAECTFASTAQPQFLKRLDHDNLGHQTACVCWIVDPLNHQKLLPIGAIGEVLIEGPNVGRGYVNAPAQTAAAFIRPPTWLKRFRDVPAATRLYKSGDLVQYAPDGSLRFIGRKDNQVKIRGQRTELGEIEHLVRKVFHGVHDVVAEVVTPVGRQPMLVAFIKVDDPDRDNHHSEEIIAAPTEAFQRLILTAEASLQESVPIHMVPALFLPLRTVPLTMTEKTDRRRLRERAALLSPAEMEAYRCPTVKKRLPTTAAERTLQQWWALVLNIPPESIGLDDSFFRLGGDSVLAMQISALARATGQFLDVADIFHSKTLSRMGPLLTMGRHGPLKTKDEVEIAFALSPLQFWFFELGHHGTQPKNRSFLVPLAKRVVPRDLMHAIHLLAQEHSMLRARFRQADDGCWTQVIMAEVDCSHQYQHCRVSSLPEARETMLTIQHNLDIRNGPLFAVALIDVGAVQQYIFLVAHYLIFDLGSWRVLLGDLDEALQHGQLSKTPTQSFHTWCRLQETRLQTIRAPTQAQAPAPQNYWGLGMRGLQDSKTSHIFLHGGFTLDAEVTNALYGSANGALRTQPVEILQAALWHAFVRIFPDRPPPTIFSEGPERDMWHSTIDLTRTVGRVTIMQPTCVDMRNDDNGDIVQVVRHTKDARRLTASSRVWASCACSVLHTKDSALFLPLDGVEIGFSDLGRYRPLGSPTTVLRPPIQPDLQVPEITRELFRFALIEVIAVVEQDRLRLSFSYGQHMRHQEAIAKWIIQCEQSLRDAVHQLSTLDTPQFSLSDFPLLSLTCRNIDAFLHQTLSQNGVQLEDLEDAYPSSPIQQGILISQAKDPQCYQSRFRWKIVPKVGSMPVDIARFQQAWQHVVDRHAILRTLFVDSVSRDGYCDQVVRSSVQANIQVIDATDKDPIAALESCPRSTYPLGQPPHRLLLCITSTRMACMLDISHSLIDAHSIRIIRQDLLRAYDGLLTAGRGPPYRNYLAYLHNQPENPAKKYWQTYLDQVSPCLVPTSSSGDSRSPHEKGLQSVHIRVEEGALLHEFSQLYEVTLSNLLQVAWGLVLRSYTSSDSVCFGYLSSGRDLPVPEVQEMVGPLINLLVCRMKVTPNRSVHSLLQDTHAEYLQSLPYQHYSLADIVHQASQSGQPLFNTIISVQRLWGAEKTMEPTSIELEDVPGEDPTEYDVAVTIGIDADHVDIHLSSWTTSSGDRHLSDMAHTFRQVILEMVHRPNDEARHLDIISPRDRSQIYAWNEHVPECIGRCVHDLILERCVKQPSAPAICAWDGDLSYQELDQLSNALAAHLVGLGIGPETFVPLCFEKSMWTPVAMLGVMKAGGAFVLLDPSHPLSRLQAICRTLSPELIVTLPMNAARAADLVPNRPVVVMGADQIEWCIETLIEKPSAVACHNAVYAVFTSGSTGTPKGVVIPHASFCTSALSQAPILGLSGNSRVFQFASYAFDVSIFDHLVTLMVGGCICVPSEDDRQNALLGSIQSFEATHMVLTPSVAKILQPKALPLLKTLVLGGEMLFADDFMEWMNHMQIINQYGPAECSVGCTIQSQITSSVDHSRSNIGYGIGCVCWIVDPCDSNQLKPIGAVGELLIEGPIVGRGYLIDETQNATAFIPRPDWLSQFRGNQNSGGLVYRTGDLVQYNATDGSLYFIGRKDTQVKLRGQRIELGEIEYHTRQCFPGATEVVVDVVVPVETGRATQLVAFVLAERLLDDHSREERKNNFTPPTQAFHAAIAMAESHLHNAFPGYMVPTLFLQLRTVPLTATGKIDRRYLREQAASLSWVEAKSLHAPMKKRMPATTAEETVQRLWALVLNIPQETIGANDSFFHLGGDSIAAIKLAGMAREDNFVLKVADVFQHPKLSSLSTHLRPFHSPALEIPAPFSLLKPARAREAILNLATIQCHVSPSQINDIYPCTALQEGLIALTAKRRGAYTACFSYNLPGNICMDDFRAAWNAVASANPILHSRIIEGHNLGCFQVIVPSEIKWAVYGNENAPRAEREASTASFGLGEPLIRVFVIQHPGSRMSHRFLLAMHHAVYDAWSLPLLLEQVASALQGKPLVPRPFSPFISYLLESKATAEAFWQGEFTGLSTTCFPQLPSPTYAPTPTDVLTHVVPLSGAKSDFTLSTKIRLAWALTISHYSGTQDVVFGLTVTGRGAPVRAVEQMTGPTFATIPLRVQLNRENTIAQTLKEIQDHSARILPYEQSGLQYIPSPGTTLPVLFTKDDMVSDQTAFTTYALTIQCDLGSDFVEMEAAYDPQVIGKFQVQQMLYHLAHIVTQIDQQPDILLKNIDKISPANQQQLEEWNGNEPERVSRCVHELIESQCQARPSAPAICAWDGEFTYSQLNALSSNLAAHLVSHGVGPETFVPLCFEKSRWTPVAMVGVMKAGGAFVLLDPSHPTARLQSISRTISAKVIVASALNTKLAGELGVNVVTVGDGEMEWHQVIGRRAVLATPKNAVYAVFTSGSTGIPKGAVIEHASFSTASLAQIKAKKFTSDQRVFQFSSYAFDTCIADQITTLVAGGCICIPSESDRMENMGKAIQDMHANQVELTPSVARTLTPDDLAGILTLGLGGEAVLPSDIIRFGGTKICLINTYGPAECCVEATAQCGGLSAEDPQVIGKGIGCVCWVVDQQDHNILQPVGAVGELLIEGPIVGRGYLNDPEKTDAVFVEPPPWLQHFRRVSPLRKLYKTGDLVQYTINGSLRFVGRKDTQVKVRGQRIELGEVEHHTRQSFPGARDVVVEVITPVDEARPPILVAFVSWTPLDHGSDHDTSVDGHNEILAAPTRGFAAAIVMAKARMQYAVPSYMVPGLFLPLVALPLTSSGKTDRRLLREHVAKMSRTEVETYSGFEIKHRTPTTAAEIVLQQLWAKVLNIAPDTISTHDGFFHRGGDSIAAMRLTSAARDDGFRLSVADVFNYPTLSKQSTVISPTSTDLPLPVEPAPFSMLPSADPESFLRETLTPHMSFDREQVLDAFPTTEFQAQCVHPYPCKYFILHIPGSVDQDRLQYACHALSQRYSILRAAFCPSNQGVIQVTLRQVDVEMDRFEVNDEDPVSVSKSLCHQDSATPPAFGVPPYKAFLVSKGNRNHVLIIRLSHAQYDGISIPVLYQDLVAAYHGDILSPTPSFSLYIQYRLSRKSAEVYQFWHDFLENASMTQLDCSAIGGICTAEDISVSVTKWVSVSGAPRWVTMASVVNAAWSLVLAQLVRRRDLVFGQLVSGRNVPITGAERILGPCIGVIPMRVMLQRTLTAGDLLDHVQTQYSRILPFETSGLRDIVQHSTTWPASTDYQIVVHHENIGRDSPYSLDGIECTSMVIAPPLRSEGLQGSFGAD